MYEVVPDTNFLIYCFKHKINFDYEIERALNTKFEVVILKPIKEELEKLLSSKDIKGKEKLAISLALSKIKNYKFLDIEGYADEVIYRYAKSKKNVIVATNDKELKNRLLESKIPVMCVRQKKYFEVFGLI
ncbi:type II toxin-antitoxin system VapC family toxin [Methanocaldococcus infernus]|uniref:PilT protein domain protein n=1 Tax=Methanocaldococcus infernus (strain DSM 11812 / JCM 15783 / ME) TaxID=573063 RepID=D5VQH9_METIM|nr:PIN domain-containing protein [Methanocaldococcus infernus]ADG12832.1 PilT protein domain protein [Methanocaldococcus infernus ME]